MRNILYSFILLLLTTSFQLGSCSLHTVLLNNMKNWARLKFNSLKFKASSTKRSLLHLGSGERLFLQDYITLIRENNFFGEWYSNNFSIPTLNYFNNARGVAMVETLNSQVTTEGGIHNPGFPPAATAAFATNGGTDIWDIVIKIYDGDYVDQKSADLYSYLRSEELITLDADNATIVIPSTGIQAYLRDSSANYLEDKRCMTNLTIYFININSKTPFINSSAEISDLGVQFELKSPECTLYAITSVLYYEPYIEKREVFILLSLLTFLAVLHIIATWRFTKALERRKTLHHVSLGSLWLIASCDYYLLIVNLVMIFAFSFLFIFTMILYVFLTFYFERELILQVVQGRARTQQVSELSDEDCRTCGLSFAISAIMFIMELVFILLAKVWIIQLTALIFVPQIIHNAIRGKPYKPILWHVGVMGLSKLLFIFYIKLYPSNLFRLYPDPLFIEVYAGLILLQLMILSVQMKYPRFCFGSKLRRGRTQPVPGEDVCPICFEPLKVTEANRSMTTNMINGSVVVPLKPKQLVETSCRHVFHATCLTEWSRNKPICPMCRQSIVDTIEEMESSSDNL